MDILDGKVAETRVASLRSRRKSIREASEALEILQKVRNMVTRRFHLYVCNACSYRFYDRLAATRTGILLLKTHILQTLMMSTLLYRCLHMKQHSNWRFTQIKACQNLCVREFPSFQLQTLINYQLSN